MCNLASIALPMYVRRDHTFDFKKLAEVTEVVTRNLNKIIDINYYPVPEVSSPQVILAQIVYVYKGTVHPLLFER